MRSSVINNERGSVISSNRRSSSNNTNDYDYINIIDNEEGRMIGGGDSLLHTLIHSLILPLYFTLQSQYDKNTHHHFHNNDTLSHHDYQYHYTLTIQIQGL